jgi:hypothetical protein
MVLLAIACASGVGNAPTPQRNGKGMAVHVDPRRDEVRMLYGFSPMAMSDFLKSQIARVHTEEYPLTR